MPYQRVNWQDGPSGGTPLSAENLNRMDEAIADAFAILDAATAAAVLNTLMKRDANGRSKVASPIDATDIANKQYVDGIGTAAANGNTIVRRDANGRAQFATPSAAADAATKGYVDGLVTGLARAHAGKYEGNGAANRPINIGWRPRFVVMMTGYESSGQPVLEIFLRIDGAPYTARIRSQNISNVFIEPISSIAIGITETGFLVQSTTTNVNGRTYDYVAIG